MDTRTNKITNTMPAQPLKGALELHDDFTDERTAGTVIGSIAASGHKRRGVDVEGVLSIDNGALRIAPLIEAGFGRAALAYGPFETRPGLAFAVYMLNGHNTAQAEHLPNSFRHRINLWIRGSQTDPQWKRVLCWLWQARFRRSIRQFRWWKRTAQGARPVTLLDENLAVGWYPAIDTPDPRTQGSGFIMHALGPENGELWAGEASGRTRSLRGVQNLPIYFVAVMREVGTIYYVCSLEGADGFSAYPWLRPVAIDYTPVGKEVYAGIHQSVLGQIGFRLDTRVHGVRVARLDGFESWCAGAHAADTLENGSALSGRPADIGGNWRLLSRQVSGETSDLAASAAGIISVLDPGESSGLIHAEVLPGSISSSTIGLVCRCLDERNHWRLELGERGSAFVFVTEGIRHVIASHDHSGPTGPGTRRLQILDDGNRLMAYVDGRPLANAWIVDARLNDATNVGIYTDMQGQHIGSVRRFEAHPPHLRLPVIFDMGAPWLRKGAQVVVADDFTGARGDLDGRLTPVGGKRWRRIAGKGFIDVTGATAAVVRASVQEPNPGRTAYCFDWSRPEFADIEVTITPAGTQVGENQRTMSGLILYQDSRNYVIVNAYRTDNYPGGSVSTFFKFGSFEDVFDAVWTNVAGRVSCGKPLRLRISSDGERYLAFIDDEPVLYRAFRDVYPDVDRLQIRKAGIIANWEFGNDTGSKFEHFRLRV